MLYKLIVLKLSEKVPRPVVKSYTTVTISNGLSINLPE